MNYYQARQREKDKRWDFTVKNDGDIRPVGYCAPYWEWWNNNLFPVSQKAIDDYKSTKDKHHTGGHGTPEEAARCYREYLLDHKLKLGIEQRDIQRKCKVCEQWTQLAAECDGFMADLCENHNNKEEFEKIYPVNSQIISSW